MCAAPVTSGFELLNQISFQLCMVVITSCALLWPSAGGFCSWSRSESRHQMCHLPCATYFYLHSHSPVDSWSKTQPAATDWGIACPVVVDRTAVGRDSLQLSLPSIKVLQHFNSASRTGLPHTEMLHQSVMKSVETNTRTDSQLEKLIFKHYLTIPGKRHAEIY